MQDVEMLDDELSEKDLADIEQDRRDHEDIDCFGSAVRAMRARRPGINGD